ncbi:acid protease [Obba rivulosa]|uniref:Acid protease n=1 Tax=Obba rivulosa TaxID=1052685 RepID=A0A8E2DSZ8_9APHY|nr:acid protease [Obba rivulosa]
MKSQLYAPSLLLYISLLLELKDVHASLSLSVSGRRREVYAGLVKRGSMSGANLQDSGDLDYYTNITLNGTQNTVLIDTGSSDLWVAGSIPGAADSGQTASVTYAIGDVHGPIKFANLEFDGYSVENQAFIEAAVDASHPGGQGLIGLGPNSGSEIHGQINNPSGDAALDRIFRANMSAPNILTILLGRSDDPSEPFPGEITVGRTIDGFENVTSQPKLSVRTDSDAVDQHWQTLTDKNGIIGPDGQPISVSSDVKGAPSGQLVAVFDSGFSLPQVPKSVADGIYGRFPQASFQNVTQGGIGLTWTLPCDIEVNITFKFGGVSIPIHPLDTNYDDGLMYPNGTKFCVGAFQPIQPGAESSEYDMILGMAFLRNAYLLVNFGDFVDGSTSNTAAPYIQLLPVTSPSAAHNDFVAERLGGKDTGQDFQLLPATPGDDDDDSDGKSFSQKIKRYLPYIIAGSVVVGLLLIGGVTWCCLRGRRQRYRPLHEPAPIGATYEHQPPPFASYQPSRRY